MCKAPAADIRLGAIVMGIGVLLGVGTMLLRLRADRPTASCGRMGSLGGLSLTAVAN